MFFARTQLECIMWVIPEVPLKLSQPQLMASSTFNYAPTPPRPYALRPYAHIRITWVGFSNDQRSTINDPEPVLRQPQPASASLSQPQPASARSHGTACPNGGSRSTLIIKPFIFSDGHTMSVCSNQKFYFFICN